MRRGLRDSGLTFDATRTDIATRLRRVCSHFAEEEFAEMVNRMAEIEVRYRLRDDWLFYREIVGRQPQHVLN